MYRRHTWVWTSAVGLVALAVLLSPGVARWPSLIVATFALGCCGYAARSRRDLSNTPAVVWMLLVAAGATLLQLVPLPGALVAWLAPASFAAQSATASALDVSAPGWMPLSLDPANSLLELAKILGYIAAAFVLGRAASSRTRRKFLAGIALIGVATGLIAVAHEAVGAENVFGLYAPHTSARIPFLSPLVNPNHLTSLMIATACLAVGLAASSSRPLSRIYWSAAATGAIALALALRSKAGLAALGLAVTVLGVGLIARKMRRRRGTKTRVAGAALAAVCVVALLVAGSWDQLTYEYGSKTLTDEVQDPSGKTALWSASWHLLAEQPWVGVGRGAFEAALPRLHPASHQSRFSYAESSLLQPLVDWGLAFGGMFLLLFFWVFQRAVLRAPRDTMHIAVLAALIGMTAHSTVDFGLEIPGLFVVWLALVLLADPPRLTVARYPRRRRALLASGALVVLLVATTTTSLREDRNHLAELDGTERLALARKAMQRHPTDHMAPAWAAGVAAQTDAAAAIPFANRALQAHPRSASMHRLVARILLATGRRAQACVEYELATRYTQSPSAVISEVVTQFPRDAANCIAPLSNSPISPVERLAALGRADLALALARRRADVSESAAHWLRLAQLEAAAGHRDAATKAARTAVARGLSPHQTVSVAPILAVEAPAEAETLLVNLVRATSHDERASALIALSELYVARGRLLEAQARLTEAMSHALTTKVRRRIHQLQGVVQTRLGNHHRAAWERARAEELSP